MSKLITLPDGRHKITGGFSNKNPQNVELVKPLIQKSLNYSFKEKEAINTEVKPEPVKAEVKKVKKTKK